MRPFALGFAAGSNFFDGRQRQKQQQIPFGDDNQKTGHDNHKSRDECAGNQERLSQA
jgi:hypothetical protein